MTSVRFAHFTLPHYKAPMITWFRDENKTVDEVVELLACRTIRQIAPRRVRRRLTDWEITKRTRVENTAVLQARIAYMFCVLGLTDDEMLHALKHKDYQVKKTSLIRI